MSTIKIDKIIRSKRRTLAIIVTHDAQLIVRAPFGVNNNKISDFISQKSKWIIKKLEQSRIKNKQIKTKQFVNGESFLYLGKSYPLKITEGNSIIIIDCLEFPRKFLSQPNEYLKQWYKKKLLEVIKHRIFILTRDYDFRYKSIKITNAKKRFGSCGPTGSLNFSWRLIMTPIEVIDYIIIHEMVHLDERNHSKNFWNKVQQILPDYKRSEKWLKENNHLLSID